MNPLYSRLGGPQDERRSKTFDILKRVSAEAFPIDENVVSGLLLLTPIIDSVNTP
jgi:hypothetical protein